LVLQLAAAAGRNASGSGCGWRRGTGKGLAPVMGDSRPQVAPEKFPLSGTGMGAGSQ